MLGGSTLVETLVMMLVAGIVFLSVMDGLALFARLQTRRTEALLTAGRQRNGYFRLESLTARADSILAGSDGVEFYRGGRRLLLTMGDSAAVLCTEAFRDTLLRGVAAISLSDGGGHDTLELTLAAGYTVRFPVKPSETKVYREVLDAIEKGYGYEE